MLNEIRLAGLKTAQATATVVNWKTVVYIFVPFALLFLIIFMLIATLRKKSRETKVLYFITESEVELLSLEIKDKQFMIGTKGYMIDKVKPLHYRDGIWGTKPFYMLHRDSPIALELDSEKIRLSSDTFDDALNNRTLKEFLNMKTSKEGIVMGIAIGTVIGIALTVIAFSTKVLKI
jgi:large-conductance mechanosensitive channel